METEIGDESLEDLFDIVDQFIMESRTLKPDELTVPEIMKRMPEIPRNSIYNLFQKLVRKGIVRSRKIIVNGKQANAYRPAKGTWEDILR